MPDFKLQETKDVFTAGLKTALVSTAVFHPFDHALFLSISFKRHYFNSDNFKNPYHGIQQALLQRSILNSIYFVMQGELKMFMTPYLQKEFKFNQFKTDITIGAVAGFTNALLTNSTAAIKSYTWRDESRNFLMSTREMWRNGGIRSFTNGTRACIYRDVMFGCVYETFRSILLEKFSQAEHNVMGKCDYVMPLSFMSNFIAGGMASIASGSFNYARVKQFNTPLGEKQRSVAFHLHTLWGEAQHKSFFEKIKFFQKRLNIGPGTVMVMAKMGIGQLLFNYLLEDRSDKKLKI